jgi:hydrogenase-1 operon protein HyaF
MSGRHIPEVPVGPGSQPPEEDGAELDYLDLPRAFDAAPRPEPPAPEALREGARAMEVLGWLEGALAGYRPDGPPLVADISGLGADDRDLIGQVLGEGEVSVYCAGDPETHAREAVTAGVWRVQVRSRDGSEVREWIEVGPVPAVARRAPLADQPVPALATAEPPTGVMSAPPLLVEIQDRLGRYRPGDPAHVINLTLLPVFAEDRRLLEQVLGRGPVTILSRGYGECRITSAAVRGLWWVSHYNAKDRLVLDTLEVVDVPRAACAEREDIADSARRLAEILEPYRA